MVSQKKTTPKTYEVRLSVNALQNIDEITGYIAFINHQPLNSLKVGDAIYDTIERISQHPFAFRSCEELPSKNNIYRRAVCLSWYIIFRVLEKDILILGVIHSSRKYSRIKALRKIK